MANVDELVDQYGKKIYNLAYRITASPQDAEDIVQETFIKVYENLQHFKGESSIYTWIYKIALNNSLKYKRRADQAYIESLEEKINYFKDQVPLEVQEWYSNPEKACLMNELIREIRLGCRQVVMQKLPDSQRVVFVLRVMMDLSYSEISEILGIGENVIKARLNRARSSLLNHFQHKCEWYMKGETGLCCQSKIGFALAQDTELLKRVQQNAEEAGVYEEAKEIKNEGDPVQYIYGRFPELQYNVRHLKEALLKKII
ncbi:MAG: sigma-70 family RNA polymerase sigma factor [Clostridia bacterium]|nr:sigma-70 family RNA polymerase sigma factor [Clostridia bacterium]